MILSRHQALPFVFIFLLNLVSSGGSRPARSGRNVEPVIEFTGDINTGNRLAQGVAFRVRLVQRQLCLLHNTLKA